MSKLNIGMLDVVRLTDGREGTVVEVYEESAKPTGYEIEISGSEMELVTVTIDEIEAVTWKSPT